MRGNPFLLRPPIFFRNPCPPPLLSRPRQRCR